MRESAKHFGRRAAVHARSGAATPPWFTAASTVLAAVVVVMLVVRAMSTPDVTPDTTVALPDPPAPTPGAPDEDPADTGGGADDNGVVAGANLVEHTDDEALVSSLSGDEVHDVPAAAATAAIDGFTAMHTGAPEQAPHVGEPPPERADGSAVDDVQLYALHVDDDRVDFHVTADVDGTARRVDVTVVRVDDGWGVD